MSASHHLRRRQWAAWSAVLALAVTGCGRATADDAFARIGIIERNADWRERPTATFVVAQDGQQLDVGEEVRTDERGFAEVEYADGSLTRLDASTVFTVIELAGTAAVPEVSVALDEGRVWNRVREVTGTQGRFEVETAVGVAAVRGTSFTAECAAEGPCRFDVHTGRVEVTTDDADVIAVDEGDFVELDADGSIRDQGQIDQDAPGDWVEANLDRDAASGRFGGLRGACSASLAGQNVARATTPERAAVVDIGQGASIEAAAIGTVSAYEVSLRVGPLTFPAASDTLTPPDDRFTGAIAVADYAFVGVGLYEVRASTEGTECALDAFVLVVGRNPLTTVLGLLGLLLLLLGLAGLAANVRDRIRAHRHPELRRKGHRLRGGLAGAAAGFGAVLLLQQYGYVPFAHWSFGAVPAVVAAVGIVIGWPSRPPT